MSADATNGDDAAHFDPQPIRRRLPNGITNHQERALICAVRNPDASFHAIADACGVNITTVQNGLQSLAKGVLGHTGPDPEWTNARDGELRDAEAFQELTDKQSAVIDFLARNPAFDWRERTAKQLDGAMRASDNVDVPAMHETYTKQIAQKYHHLIPDRRDQLAAMGEDVSGDGADPVDPFDPDTPREYLDAAGITKLPESNLDGLTEFGDTAAVPDDEKLEAAFEKASDLSRDTVNVDVAGGDFENHVGDDRATFDDDDVELGTGYLGVVNGKVDWGMWVTIGGDPDKPTDVSGVVSIESLERAGHSLDDYTVGKSLRVVAVGQSDTNDGKVRHRFEIPTIDRLPAATDDEPDTVQEGLDAEWDDESPPEAHESHENGPSATSPETGSDDTPTDSTPATGHTGDETPLRLDTTRVGTVAIDESSTPGAKTLLALAQRLDALERAHARTEDHVEENGEALPDDETARQLNEAAETVLEAEGQFDALGDRLDSLEDRVNSLEAVTETLADDVDQLHDDVDHILDRLNTVETGLSRVDKRTLADKDSVSDRLDAVEERVAAATTETTLSDAIAALEASGVDYSITATNEHAAAPTTEHECEACGQTFATEAQLNGHQSAHK